MHSIIKLKDKTLKRIKPTDLKEQDVFYEYNPKSNSLVSGIVLKMEEKEKYPNHTCFLAANQQKPNIGIAFIFPNDFEYQSWTAIYKEE